MSTPLIAPSKPKNARSKRAADARQPTLVEKSAKTAIVVRTQGVSEKVKVALSELVSPPPRRLPLSVVRQSFSLDVTDFLGLSLCSSPYIACYWAIFRSTEPTQEASLD